MADRTGHGDLGFARVQLTIAQTWNGEPIPDSERVSVSTRITEQSLEVTVEAPFHGDPPPVAPPGSVDRLWEHEVVELFVAADDDHYLEVELGPHGHFLVLALRGARNVTQLGLPIEYEARVDGSRWRGLATVPMKSLPAAPHRINAYAIHGVGAARRYLAWQPVPGDKPDFHRLECFVAADLAADLGP